MAIKSIASVKSHFETGDRPTQGEFGDLIDTAIRITPTAIASAAEGGKTGLYEILGDGDVTARSAGAVGLQILGVAGTASARAALGIVSAASEALIQGTVGSALSSWGANNIFVVLAETATTASAQTAIGVTTVGQAIITATTTASATEALHVLRSSTAQTTTSGTAFDFTGIPSWVKKITVIFNAVSLSGTDDLLVQIGDSGGLETTGYVSTSLFLNTSSASGGGDSTSGFIVESGSGGNSMTGTMTIVNVSGNIWLSSHSLSRTTTSIASGGGSKTLSGTLDRVRITRTGTDTFDVGSVNILYE